jgi:GDP-L-fucose synthase
MRWWRGKASKLTCIMNENSRIFVAGHGGLAGSAIVRKLRADGFGNLVTRTRAELDLRNQADVETFFAAERPEYVFLAAGTVGGILANDTFPADFIRDNLQIATNVIDASHRHRVEKLLYLGSSCIYPRHAPQPMPESCLLTGPLEPTNEWYAIAKIAGLKMCQAYRRQYGFDAITVMPTNLYGPGDNFDLQTAHVLPALIRKFHDAWRRGDSEIVIWGTGAPRREFMHVDDLADACIFLMQRYASAEPVNAGWGQDASIGELAELIRGISGFSGVLRFDDTKPDGSPRKLLDIARLKALGWSPRISLRDGIAATYEWFKAQQLTATASDFSGHSSRQPLRSPARVGREA